MKEHDVETQIRHNLVYGVGNAQAWRKNSSRNALRMVRVAATSYLQDLPVACPGTEYQMRGEMNSFLEFPRIDMDLIDSRTEIERHPSNSKMGIKGVRGTQQAVEHRALCQQKAVLKK